MATNARGFAPIGMRDPHTRVPFRFFPFPRTPVNTQQIATAPKKSLTLLQLLGLIGAAGLIAAIVLNQFV
ncbi:hypothetical protein SAMN05443245_5797 [Paraburkholderia fungorum]|uniref:Uncharacterized protein n=1 Tax=Paraburkholderia fungorum TaxID=134537 RepID=A0A1H1IWJ8_9BURK|nr:hypothetical protein [Paraburkholderia fungorum]SDR42085.1 hypothetical protein SAMN05443245_5797 [Paraburkholderia fungorum]